MVMATNAVVNPWTMMIESLYTSVASATMPASFYLDNFAMGAEIIRLKMLHYRRKLNSFARRDIARLSMPR